MFHALHLASRASVFRRVSACRTVAMTGASLFLLACGDDASPSEPRAGAGGAAAGSGAGAAGKASGSGGASGSSAGSGAAGVSGASDSKLCGYFNIVLNPALEDTGTAASTSLLGKLYDGENPTPMTWQKQDEADGCQLETPNAVLCQPACGSG